MPVLLGTLYNEEGNLATTSIPINGVYFFTIYNF